MSKPHSKAAFAMADTLMMTLYVAENGDLTGQADHDLDLGDFTLPVSMKVKSCMHTTKATFLLVHVQGNLGLLVAAGVQGNPLYLYVLNIAKMENMTGWFAKHNPANSIAAASLLGDAIVAKFEEKNGAWHPIEG